MGECFLIANIDKRQYLSAGSMNENPKRSGFLRGLHGRALALLMCKSDELRHGYGSLAGSWYGDRVIGVGDQNGVADVYGVATSSEDRPGRTLHELARETYEDISLAALAMLCSGDDRVVEALVDAAAEGTNAAMLLVGDLVFVAGSSEIDEVMRKRFGKKWAGRYRRACEESSTRQQMARPK
ncbi:MAG TPA: hypothetical protein VFV34_00360 [Blastocatellia bacterium]|nr:hypothetical protein [Blastocatellia bacterium]